MTISKVVLASVLVSILVLHLVQAEQLDKDLQTDSKASGEEINKIDCGRACAARCRLSSRPRLCKRACGTCCARCNCVPSGTSG
ncbi:Gibberellin regulated protein [Quillaja saponaria]|uniref:Gibberellin regulated protein n=1 Tax=Quillaja saponaria TaxID=32244 RepID=A0AAD7LGP7_QUISA|nr:Gibberellin regulated protein [Quillaja saponaria]